VVVTDEVLAFTSRLCAELDAEGLRADLVLARGAAALAALDGRKEATADDVARLAPLALAHRRRRGPLDAPGLPPDELEEALERAAVSPPPEPRDGWGGEASDVPPGTGSPPDKATGEPGVDAPSSDARPGADAPSSHPGGRPGAGTPPQSEGGPPDRRGRAGGDPRSAAPAAGIHLALKTQRPSGVLGRRNRGVADRGGIVAARPAPEGVTDLAVAATVQAAATRRVVDAENGTGSPSTAATAAAPAGSAVQRGDLRQAVREARTANLVVLCVDASGSMGATARMEAAKGAAVSLLLDAYQRRDRVALVTFAGDEARVALRPTGSVEVARACLTDLPTGGRTPLAAGLRTALDVARSARHRDPDRRPVIVVVTDSRANSAGPSADVDPVVAAMAAAGEIAAAGIEALVVDAEDGDLRLGLARQLADAMGASYTALPGLAADALTSAVRTVVGPER
ncbi:MAG TPA: VWA domain-containing protein, partial [Acidimicrobiia bacterium]|nr:VWA domain-containing protein [Acidimicrobiia bacterium]